MHINNLINKEGSLEAFAIDDPGGIYYYGEGKTLNFSQKGITDISGFDCKNYERLILWDNKITDISGFDCKNLRIIIFAANEIKSIDNFDCKNLERLDFGQNQITSIKNFDCKNLTTLHLGDNQITEIHNMKINLKPIPERLSIYLNYNPLNYVNPEIEKEFYQCLEGRDDIKGTWYRDNWHRIEQEIKKQENSNL